MATKCIVIGGEVKPESKIIFTHFLNSKGDIIMCECHNIPSNYMVVELICNNYAQNKYSIMFAYNEGCRELGCFYLGHWNDGIV